MNYAEQLVDKRWLRKRKKILLRDNFRCTVCGSIEDLQVHHTYYTDGRKAWQYSSDSLITLCHKCHYQYHYYHETTIVSEKRVVKIKRVKKVAKKIKPLASLQGSGPVYRIRIPKG